jgi:hypothetical protein
VPSPVHATRGRTTGDRACAAAIAAPARASLLPFHATIDIAFGGFAFVTVAGDGVAAGGAPWAKGVVTIRRPARPPS